MFELCPHKPVSFPFWSLLSPTKDWWEHARKLLFQVQHLNAYERSITIFIIYALKFFSRMQEILESKSYHESVSILKTFQPT